MRTDEEASDDALECGVCRVATDDVKDARGRDGLALQWTVSKKCIQSHVATQLAADPSMQIMRGDSASPLLNLMMRTCLGEE